MLERKERKPQQQNINMCQLHNEGVGNVRSECEEDEDTDCGDGDSDTDR